MYEQGFIFLPHLARLGYGVGPNGEVLDMFAYFVSGALHLFSSAVLGCGGVYLALVRPGTLVESYPFFGSSGGVCILLSCVRVHLGSS